MCWNRLERAGKGINWLDYAFIFPKFQRFYLPLFLYIIFQSSALICSSLVLDFIHHRHYPSNPWQLYPTIPSTIYPLYSPWKKFHFILWVVFILDLNSKYNITSRQPGSAQAFEITGPFKILIRSQRVATFKIFSLMTTITIMALALLNSTIEEVTLKTKVEEEDRIAWNVFFFFK